MESPFEDIADCSVVLQLLFQGNGIYVKHCIKLFPL